MNKVRPEAQEQHPKPEEQPERVENTPGDSQERPEIIRTAPANGRIQKDEVNVWEIPTGGEDGVCPSTNPRRGRRQWRDENNPELVSLHR